jgi:hypothetical protein
VIDELVRALLAIPLKVPPNVRLPEVVTVPVNVKPLTVPVPLTLVTVPEPLLLNVFQSVLVKYPLTDVVAAGILIAGVTPPEDTTGEVPVTDVTVPDPLLLNVVQSVDVKYPFTEPVAAGMLIAGVVPPEDTTGDVPVTDVTVPTFVELPRLTEVPLIVIALLAN